ncbi:MAG: archaeosine synthase subunit alpha [Archaeoglobaceae archaeon]
MFYQEKRDGYARIGRIDGRKTPTMLEIPHDELVKNIDFGVAPYAAKFFVDVSEELLPKGEIAVLSGLTSLHPRQIVRAFEEVRGRVVYCPAAATPANAALLIYLGADILDNLLAVAKAYQGVFFAGDLEVAVSEAEGLCSCRHCEELSRENVARHNTEVLRQEVEKCRLLIAREELRNYVEAKVKLNPELTAVLRILDAEGSVEHFPRFRRSRCNFSALESANRFEVRYFLNRVAEVYEPKTRTLLLLPCTARKPYLLSKTHRTIRSRVNVAVNEIIISSPLVVPREFELVYPACNYDTPVTGYWSEEEISFVAYWLRRLVEKGDFEKIVAHVEGGYKKVVEAALKDFDVVFTVEDSITSSSSLDNLRRELEDEGYDFRREIFPSVSRYQFGVELGGSVRGRYPELELWSDERVARIEVGYGRLDVYGEAVDKLIREKVYCVRIDDFEPKGTIFAAGVVEADERIRPNDVVVFYSNELRGVGVALMSGREMVESEKGAAVKVKRVLR